MRFAINIPPFTDAATLVDLAVEAEEAGWDTVMVWDHLQWIASLELEVHDPWALLSAMAVRTERVRLGTCVTPLSRRRPQVVAKQLVTLDHLSGGRAVLGAGLGEPPDSDFADFGDEADARLRGQRLDEALEVIGGLVSGEPVAHRGRHFRVRATLRPASIQRPRPPVLIAGIAPHRRPLERALRWDGFLPIGADGPLSPGEVADYLDGTERPDGWELLVARHPDHRADAYAEVGVTCLVEGTWPMGDWVEEFRGRIAAGPPGP
jgi:alkanesulfonate monooxygenase SsuD/methylene tetrahydromethanopterin reductase-like flavin-dependent oxidoreductase (luciferase family)